MSTRCGWKRVRGALSHAGLLLALAIYTAVGGLVFRALEGPAEAGRLRALQNAVLEGRRQLLAVVANATLDAEARLRALRAYEALVHDASRGGVEVPGLTAGVDTPPRWTLLQGVFFASTVLTTIGYGHLAPVTVWGRAFCLAFALVGIPLTLTVIADLGVLLASAVSTLPCWGRCRRWWTLDDGPGRNALLALGAVLLLLLYLAAGAAMFTLWEDGWDFWDGFYFCFITMTTIGFGDLVPRHPSYTLLCTLYILMGLAMTSTIIELVRRQYATSWRRLQEALSESGPVLGDVLRRLGAMPDVHIKGVLAAVSLARLVPMGGARPVALNVGPPQTAVAAESQAHREWERALSAVLQEMEEKARKEKEADAQRKRDEEEKRRKEKERQRRRARREGRVIEIIVYETTV